MFPRTAWNRLFLSFVCTGIVFFSSVGWSKVVPDKPEKDKPQYEQQKRIDDPLSQKLMVRWEKAPPKAEYEEGEVLVKFKQGTSIYQAEEICYQKKMSVDKHYKALSNMAKGRYMHFKSDASTVKMIQKLKEDPRVEAVSPNYIRHMAVSPDDPEYPLWGLQQIDAEAAWNTNTGSYDVVVANIDTGVDHTHQDLETNMWSNPGESLDGTDNDNNGYVDDVHGINAVADNGAPMDYVGHGTHTAGTIGAMGNNGELLTGVNWDVEIMALKFLGPNGGTISDAIQCMDYVIQQKKDGENIVAINASWGGGGHSEIMKEVISELGDLGILFVAAAGNWGIDNEKYPHYPSSYELDNIISVAASNQNDNLTYFSNYGTTPVDLAAPGINILSTVPGGGYLSQNWILYDDMESGADKWSHGGNKDSWVITEEESVNSPSGNHTWSDSNNTEYENSVDAWLREDQPADLSNYNGDKLALGGWLKYDIESYDDKLYLEISKDGGQSWTPIGSFTGNSTGWSPGVFYVPESYKTSEVYSRFRLETDSSVTEDGAYIDDVGLGVGAGSNATAYYAGTSKAAPHVTGAVALMAAEYPNEDMLTRKNRVLSGVDRVSSLGWMVSKEGRLNLADSIDLYLDLDPLVTGSVRSGMIPGTSFILSGRQLGSRGKLEFFNGTTIKEAEIESWSDSSITAQVPQESGKYIRVNNIDGQTSNIIRGSAWKEMQKASTGIAFGAGVSFQGDFYHLGGYDESSSISDATLSYDAATNTWSDKASMPDPYMLHDAASMNDFIYVLGGFDSSRSITGSLMRYDPDENGWSAKPSDLGLDLDQKRYAHQGVSLGGNLYCIGGRDQNSEYTNTVYAYDPDTNSWSQKASMNMPRAYHGAVALNGKIYAFGGYNGTSTLSSCEVYDPNNDVWTQLPDMPIALYSFGITTDGEEVFLAGGFNNVLLRFDPDTEEWTYRPNSILELPRSRVYASSAFLTNYGHFFFGGYGYGYGYFSDLNRLDIYATDDSGGGGGGGCMYNPEARFSFSLAFLLILACSFCWIGRRRTKNK